MLLLRGASEVDDDSKNDGKRGHDVQVPVRPKHVVQVDVRPSGHHVVPVELQKNGTMESQACHKYWMCLLRYFEYCSSSNGDIKEVSNKVDMLNFPKGVYTSARNQAITSIRRLRDRTEQRPTQVLNLVFWGRSKLKPTHLQITRHNA